MKKKKKKIYIDVWSNCCEQMQLCQVSDWLSKAQYTCATMHGLYCQKLTCFEQKYAVQGLAGCNPNPNPPKNNTDVLGSRGENQQQKITQEPRKQ